jgi:hypothetical protein
MPSAVPPSLASYIQASLDAQSQTLITSVLNTPSTWLALRVVYAAIHGVEDVSRGHSLALDLSHHAVESRPFIFVSLLRPLSLWTEMGRKMVRVLLRVWLTFSGFSLQPFCFVHAFNGF